jgi:hypothetical protein
MKDVNEQMNEDIERGENHQEKLRRDISRNSGGRIVEKPDYKASIGSGGHKISHFRFFAGIIAWIGMSFIGGIYFSGTLSMLFAIGGIIMLVLIVYSDWWYPKLRRWRRGY